MSRFDLRHHLQRLGVRTATPDLLASLNESQRARSVILVQDAFTRWFDTPVWAAFIELAVQSGHMVFVAPYRANGKPLHVQGFLGAFRKAAQRQAALLRALGASGIPLVGLEPAMTLVFRQEYRKTTGAEDCPPVLLPQEWLEGAMSHVGKADGTRYRLLSHCTERTNVPSSNGQWIRLFARLGLTLEAPATGCCGMAGTYGHEARNEVTSKTIFEQSWGPAVDASGGEEPVQLLATGYSCRCQVERMRGKRLPHPVEILRDAMKQAEPVKH